MSNKKKGDVLEALVATLHKVSGVEVRCKAQVTVLGLNATDTREIDVLLEGTLADYPVRISIECKNWRKPVGVEIIDSFYGKLQQVGIPLCHGIVVSACGYTAPAKRRAEGAGIRLLEFEGLTADRMDRAVHEAFQSAVFVGLRWVCISLFPLYPSDSDLGSHDSIQFVHPREGSESLEGWAIKAVWTAWATGKVPLSLGEYTMIITESPEGAASPSSSAAFVTVAVVGHLFSKPGTVRISQLRNAATQKIERARADAEFADEDRPRDLIFVPTEQELRNQQPQGALHIDLGRIRIPRIELGIAWFPFSERALLRFKKLESSGELPTFDNIEGRALIRAWDPAYSTSPSDVIGER